MADATVADESAADFTIDESNAESTGVYIGSGIGGLPLLEKQHRELLERGPRRMSPFFFFRWA